MTIQLIFHPPAGAQPMGFMYELNDSQTGLIPNVGDMVQMNGSKRKITAKSFTFHPGMDRMEIEFATE
jgi:hypothetical protein